MKYPCMLCRVVRVSYCGFEAMKWIEEFYNLLLLLVDNDWLDSAVSSAAVRHDDPVGQRRAVRLG